MGLASIATKISTTRSSGVPLSLRGNMVWTLLGNVIYAGCQWGMLSALAKLGSIEMVGQFVLGVAVTTPILMLTNLQLRAVQAADATRRYRFGSYLATRLITTAVAMLAIALIAGGCYGPREAVIIVLVGVFKAVESVSDTIYGLLQQRERMDRIAQLQIIKGLGSVICLVLVLMLTRSAVWSTAALAGAGTLCVLLCEIPTSKWMLQTTNSDTSDHFGLCWDVAAIKRLVWINIPLGMMMMLVSVSNNIPRYFVEHYCGIRELGIFTGMSYVMIAGFMVIQAAGQAAVPRISRYHVSGNRAALRALMFKLLGIAGFVGVSGVAVAAVAGKAVLTILYRSEYSVYHVEFVVVMIAAGISYVVTMLVILATATDHRHGQQLAMLVVAIVTAVACWGLIGYGLIGVAVATIIATVAQLLVYVILLIWPWYGTKTNI